MTLDQVAATRVWLHDQGVNVLTEFELCASNVLVDQGTDVGEAADHMIVQAVELGGSLLVTRSLELSLDGAQLAFEMQHL